MGILLSHIENDQWASVHARLFPSHQVVGRRSIRRPRSRECPDRAAKRIDPVTIGTQRTSGGAGKVATNPALLVALDEVNTPQHGLKQQSNGVYCSLPSRSYLGKEWNVSYYHGDHVQHYPTSLR